MSEALDEAVANMKVAAKRMDDSRREAVRHAGPENYALVMSNIYIGDAIMLALAKSYVEEVRRDEE